MTVAELIAFLQKQDQTLQVVYNIYSELALLEEAAMGVEEACLPRPDGWVHRKRPDQPTQKYFVLPGN